jgi:hypothetical protein
MESGGVVSSFLIEYRKMDKLKNMDQPPRKRKKSKSKIKKTKLKVF